MKSLNVLSLCGGMSKLFNSYIKRNANRVTRYEENGFVL